MMTKLDHRFNRVLEEIAALRAAGVTQFSGPLGTADAPHSVTIQPKEREPGGGTLQFECPAASELLQQALHLEAEYLTRQAEDQTVGDLFGASELGSEDGDLL